jgi:hypothetical protein
MKRAFVFDIDNTLTPPREPLEPEMARLLQRLTHPFALAAGSDAPLLMTQFFEPLQRAGFRGDFDAFVCNGAARYRCHSGETLELTEVDGFSLQRHLGGDGFVRLMAKLHALLDEPSFALPPECVVLGERVVDRASMINFAPIGRPLGVLSAQAKASREHFVRFDTQTGYRRRGLERLQRELAALLPVTPLRVSLGGQTSFDIVARGRDKSFAVRSLLDQGFEHVTYFGDALFPSGNDAAVLELVEAWVDGVCPVEVVQVDGPADTAAALQQRGLLLGASAGSA